MARKYLIFACATFIVLTCAFVVHATGQQKALINGVIDDASRITITGSRHPLARPSSDIGTVDPGMKLDRMVMVLGISQEQEKTLQGFLDSQHDTNSPNYHHWLTPEEFGQKFGPAPQDIEAATQWLVKQGFSVGAVARSGRWVEFSGTSGQVERTFHTLMRQYTVKGQRHIANATDISIPAKLSPVMRGVLSLHDFRKHPMVRSYLELQHNSDGTFTSITPDATSSTGLHALSAGDFAAIYGSTTLNQAGITGAGQTIAIVARRDIFLSDVQAFRSAFALPPNNPVFTFNGPALITNPNEPDTVEATLDTEWAGAVAQGATINLVTSESTPTTDGVDLSSAYIVDNNLAPIMSVSFGACEANLGPAENSFYSALWQQAAAQGISVFIASGDSGAAGCDFPAGSAPATHGLAVSGLASTPFSTAVGGTQFNEGANPAVFWSSANQPGLISAKGYIPEVVWNESCDPRTASCPNQLFELVGSGGGSSSLYTKPGWQSTGISGVANDGARDVPDVSLTAAGGHDPYLICFNGSCNAGIFGAVGGTSASAPAFAGIMALVNQAAGSRQGLPNYMLYRLAAAENFSICDSGTRLNVAVPSTCVFNDITAGDNSVPGLTGFPGGLGFDRATGLGSVNVANLVNAWKAHTLRATTTTLTPISITAVHGQPVPLTVDVSGPAAPSPGGNVSFLTDKFGPVSAAGTLVENAAGAVSTFSGSIADLPGGTYNLTAHYPGDAVNAPSDSSAVTVSVTPENSVVTLDAFAPDSAGGFVSARSFPYASLWALHATVKGISSNGIATGIVNFQETTTPSTFLPSATLNQKSEVDVLLPSNLQFNPLPLGTHTITASWIGDQSFNGASAAIPLSITVTKGNPGVSFLPFSAITATVPAQIVAAVGGNLVGIPVDRTGTVQLFEGTTLLDSATISNGVQATLHPVFTSTGTHTITATYSGDGTYNPATSPALTVTVLPSFGFFGTTKLIVPAGQTATYNLNVSGTAPGPIALACSGAPVGSTCTVNPSSISLNAPTVPFTVTVATSSSAQLAPLPFRGIAIVFATVVAILLAGNKRAQGRLSVLLLVGFLLLNVSACGGGASARPTPAPTPLPLPPTNATLTITGTSGSQTLTFPLSLTITH